LLSLEFILEHAPERNESMVEYATALAEAGEISEAVAACGRLLKDDPTNQRVIGLVNQMLHYERSEADSVLAVTAAGGRPSSKPVGRANLAKQSARPGCEPEETVQDLILKYKTLLQHGPNNHMALKKLGALYAEELDFDRALEYYWRALQAAHGKDAETERAIQEIDDLKASHDLEAPTAMVAGSIGKRGR
jgi:cytochrome c-type biogenesis protein CcmH/NrfG